MGGIRIAGGVKITGGAVLGVAVPPGADWTETLEDASFVANDWDDAFRTLLIIHKRPGEFTRDASWHSSGSYCCKMEHVDAYTDYAILERDHGQEPIKMKVQFKNNQSSDAIIIMGYGGLQNVTYRNGFLAYFAQSGDDLHIAHFNGDGYAVPDDSNFNIGLADATEYYILIEIGTNVVVSIYRTSDDNLMSTLSVVKTNFTLSSNEIFLGFNVPTTGTVLVDQMEVWN